MIPNGHKITDFISIFEYIMYDSDTNHTLQRDKDGNFYVNKLQITRDRLIYKTECRELSEGLFEKVEKLYTLIKGQK